MDSKYVILELEQLAIDFSRKVWQLCSPYNLDERPDVTQYIFGIIKHPTKELWAIEIQPDYEVTFQPTADPEPVFELFPEATEQEKDNFTQLVKQGATIQVIDIFPESNKQYLKTYDDLHADGWFEENIGIINQ